MESHAGNFTTISMCHCADSSVVLNMPFADLLLSQHMHFFLCSLLPLVYCRCIGDHHSTCYVIHTIGIAKWLGK